MVAKLLGVLLVLTDIAALCVAFMLGYIARETLGLFNPPPVQPPFERYIVTMVLHAGMIIAIFYFSQMYHQRRALSRIDHGRNIVGDITDRRAAGLRHSGIDLQDHPA